MGDQCTLPVCIASAAPSGCPLHAHASRMRLVPDEPTPPSPCSPSSSSSFGARFFHLRSTSIFRTSLHHTVPLEATSTASTRAHFSASLFAPRIKPRRAAYQTRATRATRSSPCSSLSSTTLKTPCSFSSAFRASKRVCGRLGATCRPRCGLVVSATRRSS